MLAGVVLGKLLPGLTAALSQMQFGQGSQVNVPMGILPWLMIHPRMLKVDFSAIGGIARKPKGLLVTLFVNWLIKPFSMALLAWVIMQHVFVPKPDYVNAMTDWNDPLYWKIIDQLPPGTKPADYITSLEVKARKGSATSNRPSASDSA